jgi:non-specific serine/threonine protein kinase/serine/threonine-protein kinase
MSITGGPMRSNLQGESTVAQAAIAAGSEGGSTLTPISEQLKQSTDGPDPGELSTVALDRIAAAVAQEDSASRWIGRYRLIEVVGEGGMGEVWRAEQEQPIRRIVALKLIKVGMDTREVIARFEMERQALALLNHPNVAKVLDAGATESGRPYFVMEYVAGEPIMLFCDRHRYSIRQRLQLFSQACAAVGHAHQRGILHRDIKSANILVTAESGDPQVKVIDFGIAKALQGSAEAAQVMQTLAGQLLGTPEYMSPEQALTDGRDVDTRSDVYSLGVVLYELLGGMLPFDSRTLRSVGLAEIQRVIREVEPTRPSARLSSLNDVDAAAIAQRRQTAVPELIRQLRRELEWIPLKAIRKDPSARYAGVSEFASDVENYLAQRPLLAGPESRLYRLRKFLRRRRFEAIAASLVIFSLLAGMIGTVTFAVRESRQRDLAERRADETTQIANFQAEMLSGLEVERMGLHLRQDLLDEAEQSWRPGVDEEEIARRREELRSLLADANFTSTAIRSLDENVFDRALKTIDRKFENQPLLKAKLLQQLATTLREFTLLKSAMSPQAEALKIRRRELRDDDPDLLESMSEMGLLMGANGDWPEAERYARRVLDQRRKRLSKDDVLTLRAKRNLAEALQRQGLTRVAEAERYRFEVLAGFQRIRHDVNDPETQDAMLRVGQVLMWQKKLPQAQPYVEEALEQMRQSQGDNVRATLVAAGVLARLRFFREGPDQAEQLARESFDGLRQLYGDDSRDVLFASRLLGSVYRAQKNPAADPCLQRAVNGFRRLLPPDHLDTLLAIQELGIWRYQQRNFVEARKTLGEALEGFRRKRGDADEDTLWTLHYLGWSVQASDGWSAAEPIFRELYERALGALLPPADAARLISDYGPCLVMLSKYGQARGPLSEAHKRLTQEGLQRDERMRVVVWALAEMYDHTGRATEAARWRDELSRLRSATQPAGE